MTIREKEMQDPRRAEFNLGIGRSRLSQPWLQLSHREFPQLTYNAQHEDLRVEMMMCVCVCTRARASLTYCVSLVI